MEIKNSSFLDFGLSEEIIKSIKDLGYLEPSPIQTQAIPLLLKGHDIIGQAQTGSGKTAAFGIPAIEKINTQSSYIQCLVLCPTRELAIQVNTVFKKLGKYKPNFKTAAIYGGESIEKQIKTLKNGVHSVIGTPGRILDHLERGTLNLNHVETVILDEADEMLNMGFIDDIKTILSKVPEKRQTVFFSATMPDEILELTKKFQKNPVHVKIAKKEVTVSSIEQKYYYVKSELKKELLCRILDYYDLQRVLVFCNTKRMVDDLVEFLQSKGYSAEGLHGDMRQGQRNLVMNKFRQGILKILIATDVAARGIDVENVEAVFNYDLPLDVENYVHRIGRTGRAGRSGLSFSFVSKNEKRRLKEIENYTKASIEHCQPPTVDELVESKRKRILENLKLLINTEDLTPYITILKEITTNENLDIYLLAAAFLKDKLNLDTQEIDFTEIEKRYKAEQPTLKNKTTIPKSKQKKAKTNANHIRVFLNVGKKDKISPGDIVGAITGETGINGNQIGAIDIFDKYSFVDLPEDKVNDIIQKMNQRKIKGIKVNMEIAH